MRLTGSRGYARPAPTPTLPPGLVELMEGLAKDVLKNNPENVYEFCAVHMQKLLEIRDGPEPPKKQLPLEQKIVKAQERLRQRIKNRYDQRGINTSEQSNENDHLEDKPPVIEVPIETTLAIQPVVEISNENTSAIQPVVNTAIKDTSAIQPIINTAVENSSTIQSVVKTTTENTPVILPVVHGEKTYETSADEASLSNHDNDVQSNEASQAEHELTEDVFVATQLVQEDSTEKVIEEVIIGGDTKQISDIEAIAESKNVTNIDEQSKNYVDPNVDDIKHAENTPRIDDNNEIPLNEFKPTVSEIESNVEGNIDNLNDEAIEKELIEVDSTLPLANDNDDVLSHSDDIKTTEKNVVEEKMVVKEELTDTQYEEILLEKYANKIEPEESINVVLEKQELIKKEESADIQPKVILAEKKDNIEYKESIKGITHVSEENVVDRGYDKLLPQAEYPTIGELTINQIETPRQTETVSDGNLVVHPTVNETPEISNPQHDKETDAELTENHAILNNDDIVDHDVHKNNVHDGPKVDEELNDNNDKLRDQENENIQDDITTLTKNNTIIESDETPESTAVSGMDLETAAITIQKVFRTFLFSKSRTSTLDDTVNDNSLDEDIEKKDEPEYILSSSNLNKERRTLGISRMDTVLQTVNEEKSLSLSDDSSLSSAATTIQAHVRGFLVRNRLASNKTASSSSLVNSDGPSTLSSDGDVNEPKKTILNIHIVPERGQFMSRDESLLTSIDLPLDNSPPSSLNLHPLGYDKSAERRKQLKREDAVQSISPPSNNSGKLSEEVDTVKDALNDSFVVKPELESVPVNDQDKPQDADSESCDTTLTISSTAETVVDADTYNPREVLSSPDHNVEDANIIHDVITNSSSDEMDVVTPYSTIPEKTAKVASAESENDDKPKLVHSGEFHDIVVQTQVKRNESSVVREFKNVLVYFLLWDKT